MLEFTDRAAGALARSDAAARRFNPDARVRLVGDGAVLRPELTDRAEPGDAIVRHDLGFEVYVAEGIEGLVDAGEHDALFLTGS
jgi:hypothetical protein